MVPYWDVIIHMPKADEYIVKVVRDRGYYKGVWREYGRYETRNEAVDTVEYLIKRHEGTHEFRAIGIEPHVKEAGIFQTAPLQEVWVA